MTSLETPPQKIAIIGAGFTGVALAAALHRTAKQPLEITIYEKSGEFGAGDAYRTPYSWHLLNARACDMSAFEDDPDHFVRWVEFSAAIYLENGIPHGKQFLPRMVYHQYICSLMANIFQDDGGLVKLYLVPEEIIDLTSRGKMVELTSQDGTTESYHQVVLAYGNNPPASLPCSVHESIHYIANPWDYTALKNIPADDAVLIVGTGLTMVDAVMTLHHQEHHGKIYALSRRGLLPLPHTDTSTPSSFDAKSLPNNVRKMMRMIRREADKFSKQGGDWRAIMCQLRQQLPTLWKRLDIAGKKQFLRHVLPYWNIHRHRVHEKIHAMLLRMQLYKQLEVLAGRLVSLGDQEAQMRLRHAASTKTVRIQHVINCIGSSNTIITNEQPLLAALLQRDQVAQDELKLGLSATEKFELKNTQGEILPACYTLGPPLRGDVWETVAVPEIRKQCYQLAQILLDTNNMSDLGVESAVGE